MVAGKSGIAQSSFAPRGLSTDEARRRLERTGPNALPAHAPEPWWQPWRRQFQSPLIYILLAALGVDLIASLVAARGVPIDAVTIAAILCLNAALGVWQERRARDALAHLRALAAPHVWVLRDDRLERVPAQDVVPGDAVWLNAGDRVPADVRVTRTARLAVDESILTGESLPVEKAPDDEAFSGTLVVAGTGYAEVTRTGNESALGRLATLLQTVEAETTPLIRRLNAFGARVARWILALVVVLAVVGILAEGISHAGPALLLAVALAVAAVPEALPAVMTITLALGVERMARRRAVVRTLSAVEALGSVTVIVTDKTGTLTENRLEVRALDTTDPARAIRAIWLANDADAATGAGDPLDLALRAYVTSDGPEPAPAERISSRPFEARTRSMRVTCREGDEIVS
ncbi:MAG TPA: HAD-IC family P-type ATPase, partial [Gemmatimonadales bacterium]|nr:HAD-IC family P-type ATPase [Gemmatimonadales bacterium]